MPCAAELVAAVSRWQGLETRCCQCRLRHQNRSIQLGQVQPGENGCAPGAGAAPAEVLRRHPGMENRVGRRGLPQFPQFPYLVVTRLMDYGLAADYIHANGKLSTGT